MRTIIAILFVALLAAAPQMMGQMSMTVTADIPFAMSFHGREFAAGQWEFQMLPSPANLVSVRNPQGSESFLLTSNVFQEAVQSGTWPTKLVFHRYGDKYFLSEIHYAWPSYRHFVPGKQERDLQVAGLRPAKTWIFAKLK